MTKFGLISEISLLLFCCLFSSASAEDADYLENRDFYLKRQAHTGIAALELEAFDDKKIGKLETRLSYGDVVYTLNVQGPIDEKTKNAEFADLDGLKNGKKITLNIQLWNMNVKKLGESTRENVQACSDLINKQKELLVLVTKCKENFKNEAKKFENAELFAETQCKPFIDELNKLPKSCSETRGYQEEIAKRKEQMLDLSTHILGVAFSYGKDQFNWIDASTLEDRDDNKASYAAEAQYGLINNRFQRFNFGFRYENYWKSKQQQNICKPLSQNAAALSCNNSSLEAPDEVDAKIAYAEWKYYFGQSDRFAMAPRVSRDFENKATGIDIPVYLYQVADALGLQGGVRFGWRSDTKETISSLFFSKPFSISN